MRFRPCIDIHNGKVKQIVGQSLTDEGDYAQENFSSEQDAAYYADMYRRDGLTGGHIILLNAVSSPYYEATRTQAVEALHTFPQGMQVGGGITSENAAFYLQEGASHVIVTSYVFRNGQICFPNLERLVKTVGKEHIVLDVSCRKKDGSYYIVTDRWQTFTEVVLTKEILCSLSAYCDEFLIHGVDAEGRSSGVEQGLLQILSGFEEVPVTYAGGIAAIEDVKNLRALGKGKIDFTIGSALDLFGGDIPYQTVIQL